MKSLLGKSIILFLCALMLGTNAFASDGKETYQKEAVYDLNVGGTKKIEVYDEDGKKAYVTISEITTNNRINNGDYQVTYTSPGAWRAGFKVTISNNKIIRVYSPSYEVVTGRISGASLVRNNDTRATYSFVYSTPSLSISTGVKAVVSNNQLIVSKL